MKKKGFTLIELLAVIVILAIIALIATPIVMNVIENSRISAHQQSANNLAKAASTYAMENYETIKNSDVIFYVKNGKLQAEGLDFNGKLPKEGILYLRKDGKVTLALSDNGVCYKKGFDDEEVSIIKDAASCDITDQMEYEEDTITGTISQTEPTTYSKELKSTGTTGLVKYDDNKTYYAGAAVNNYVWFGGFKWRVINIDQAGNIKLMTDNPLTFIPVGEIDNPKYDSLKDTYVGEWLTEEFLANFSRKNDLMTVHYSTPGLTNPNQTWLSKVSLLTVDEATKLGLKENEEYSDTYGTTNYYDNTITNLFKKDNLEMFADIAWKNPEAKSGAIRVRYTSGTEIFRRDLSQYNAVRPVVTIPGSLKIVSGDGTESKPYVFEGENNANSVNKMVVGEYVTLPNGDQAILIAKNDKTNEYKFVLRNVTENMNGAFAEKDSSETNQFSTELKSFKIIDNYFKGLDKNGKSVKTDITSYLDTEKEHTWYVGAYNKGYHYNKTKESVADYKGAYAFLRVGELMENPDGISFYTMTPAVGTTKETLSIHNGFVNHSTTSRGLSPRPAFYLKGNIEITSGSGQYNDPYVLK